MSLVSSPNRNSRLKRRLGSAVGPELHAKKKVFYVYKAVYQAGLGNLLSEDSAQREVELKFVRRLAGLTVFERKRPKERVDPLAEDVANRLRSMQGSFLDSVSESLDKEVPIDAEFPPFIAGTSRYSKMK